MLCAFVAHRRHHCMCAPMSRPPQAMVTMQKALHVFIPLSTYGAPLGALRSGHRNFAMNKSEFKFFYRIFFVCLKYLSIHMS